MHDPTAFEPRNVVWVVTQLCQDTGIVGAQDRRQSSNRCRRAIEASRRPWHPHSAECLTVKLFEDVILADLIVL
jgi:hypothetical protein